LQQSKPGHLKAPVEKVIHSVAKALNITFAAAERDMRRHALFLDNQMKQASGSPESYGLAQSPVWTWLKDQRGQMPGVTNRPSTDAAPGQSSSVAGPSTNRMIGVPDTVSKLSSAGSGTLVSWLLPKQTQASTSMSAALPGSVGTPSAPTLTRKDAATSAATVVEATGDKPAKPTKQATATSSRKPETQPSTKENKAPSTSARKKPSTRTETEVEPEAGPSGKPPSISSRSVRSATSSRKRSHLAEATTSGVEHVTLDPESTGSSARRPIKATRKTLVPKIKSLYEDAAKNMHIVEFPTYKYPENGVWCCWLPDCKKQINVANYDDKEDLVEATVAEHIEEHYNAIWNKWTPARRKNYEQLVRNSEVRVRRWIDENEDMRKEKLLMAMGTDVNFSEDDAMRVEKPPIQWPSFGSAMSGVKRSKDPSSTMHRPLLHILDGGGASEKERLFRVSQRVGNNVIFSKKKKQPRRSLIPMPTLMARIRAPAPAPSAVPAEVFAKVPAKIPAKIPAKVSDRVLVAAAPIPPPPANTSASVPNPNPAPAQPSVSVPDQMDIIAIDDDDDDGSVDAVKFVGATRKKETDVVIHDSKLENVKSKEKEKMTLTKFVMVLDCDDEEKVKSSVPVPSTYALSSFKSLVQGGSTVGKSRSPGPRKDSTIVAAKIKDSPFVMAKAMRIKEDTLLKGSAVSVGRGNGSADTAVPKSMPHYFVNLDSEDEELMGSPSKKTKLSGKGKQAIDLTLPEEIVKETGANVGNTVAIIQDVVHDSWPSNLHGTTVLPDDQPGIGVSSLRSLKLSNERGSESGYDTERAPAGLASDSRGTTKSVGNLFTTSSHNMPTDSAFAHSSPAWPLSIDVASTGISTPRPPIDGILPLFLPLLPTSHLHPIPAPSVPAAQWTCTNCTAVHTVKTGLSYSKCDVCDAPRI
ncbi:hypothetical protein BC936DRAFT_146484, partial [Jimgerdemannia flammicorona]